MNNLPYRCLRMGPLSGLMPRDNGLFSYPHVLECMYGTLLLELLESVSIRAWLSLF